MTFTYTVLPIEPLMALNNWSTNMTSMISFPKSPGVTVTEAYVDPVTTQLVVKVDYTTNLQDTALSMKITPPNVPQASLMPSMTNTWTVAPTNLLSASVYTESQY